ncbi:helix-turn-helix domain-containing protein [Orrella sp. 11846]|uniref:helix-turn-helix domain-containing protein n=1 Tax=Orrella sp. 11846 TaxID=3409913 RepID=UPI003B5A8DD0
MNTEYESVSQAEAPETPETLNALEAMRSVRESRGLSQADVAYRLKFSEKQIDALENARWEEFQDSIGLRVLARNYSKMLGIEMSSLEPFLPDHRVRGGLIVTSHHQTINKRDPGLGAEPEPSSRSWPWLAGILLVVLVVLVIAIWQGVLPEENLPAWIKGMIG